LLLSAFRAGRGRVRGSVLAPRNWRVASRLILLVAIPAILGLTLAGLRTASAMSSARSYAKVTQNAALGQQVAGLAHALESERTGAAVFVADGRPASGLAALARQYAATDARAASVRRLVAQLDRAQPPARTRASAASAVASIAALPGLRRATAQGPASSLDVTTGYTTAISGLFPVVDGIADLGDNPVLITSVRALGSLARLTDQAAQQQAILGAALAGGRFEPGALMALTVARAQQATDVATFQGSATAEESWALTRTLNGPQARQASAAEQRAIAAGDGALAIGPQATAQWQDGSAYTVGWLRHAEQQLTRWITADAQNQQRSADTSALLTGGIALAGLLLTVLFALLIVRSVVGPLRRLEAAALDAADYRLPAEVRALAAGEDSGPAVLAAPIEITAGGEIGEVARAFGRLHQEAVRVAGEEARLRESAGAVVASFFERSHPLHDRLLRLIDSMELSEDNPDLLARLFQMDNLATRMRRHSDTALVLAGHQSPRRWTEPVPLVDVLRASASEVEQYDQIAIDVQSDVVVSDEAAVDVVHLLAELLENATSFSPGSAQVSVSGFADSDGEALIAITDEGPGLPDDYLGWLNWQLAHPMPADATVVHQMGLFAVSHLAARHGISVVLTRPPEGGTTVQVRLPADMVATGAQPWNGASRLEATHGRINGRDNGASAVAGDPHHSAPQLPAGQFAAEDGATENRATEDRAAEDRAADAALTLGAPVPAPALDDSPAPTGPLPIFDSVQSALPRRISRASALAATPADRELPPAPSPESARDGHRKLASFQQGSRRARATAQLEREAEPSAEGE
jgi:signal transduction histidine kinase